jgi:uncharacterized membrane protein YeaQ/YmgE (transglycosylase-associated protein family)
MDLAGFLLIGLLAGWLAGQIMKGGDSSVLTDLIVGMIGAVIGGFLLGLLHIPTGGVMGSLAAATLGAILLLSLLRGLKRSF